MIIKSNLPLLTLTADGSVLITLPALPARAASLSIERGVMVNSVIQWGDNPIATGLLGNSTYTDTGLVEDQEYFYRIVAVNPGGETPGPSVSIVVLPPKPPAPGDIIFSDIKATKLSIDYDFDWDVEWLHLFVYRKVGSNWVQWGTELTENQKTAYLENLTSNSVETFEFGATGENGTSYGPPASIKMAATEVSDPPEKPDTITFGPDHPSYYNTLNVFSYQEITVIMPVWSASTTAPVENMELWMSEDNGNTYTKIEDNTTSHQNIVIPVDRFKVYYFKARAINTISSGTTIQYSDFSDPSYINLTSTTCIIDLTEPVTGDVHLTQDIRATITDTGATDNDTGVQLEEVYVRNLPQYGVEPIEGEDNVYGLTWDTRQNLNGEAEIDFYALGSDLLWTKDSVTVNINNTLKNNIIYKEYKCELQKDGYVIVIPHFGIESYEINSSNLRKGWLQLGVRTGGTSVVGSQSFDWDSWFSGFKIIPLHRGTCWMKDENNSLVKTDNPEQAIITQYGNNDELDTYGNLIYYALKISPYENIAGYKVNADKILKIREYTSGKLFVLTQSPSYVIIFDRDTETITDTIALSDYGYENVLDAAQVGDDIFVVTMDHKIVRIDITVGDVGEQLDLLNETKLPSKIETVSTTSFLLLYEDSENNKITGYLRSPDSNVKLWDLDASISKIYYNNGTLGIADGPTLYTSKSSSGSPPVPTLSPFIAGTANNFPSNIEAMYSNLVLLDNGALYEMTASSSTWSLVINTARDDLTAVSRNLEGNEIYISSITANIELNSDISWQDNKVINITEIDMNNLSDVTQMWNLDKLVTAASGTEGSDNYVPAVYSSKLIMAMSSNSGTKDAVLVAIEKSPLSQEDGVALVSKLDNVDIFIEDLQDASLPHRTAPGIENGGSGTPNADVGPST